ncbi:MAG: hypothetical protein ACOYM3_14920, partial [Terrimicrobiaceae bacterium]
WTPSGVKEIGKLTVHFNDGAIQEIPVRANADVGNRWNPVSIENGLVVDLYLARHHAGDWGDVGADDAQANADGLAGGDRLLSAYRTPFGHIWIITEADRSSTCVLLPDEY